jgi:hypothetical protein
MTSCLRALLLCGLCVASPSFAAAPVKETPIRVLDTLVVSGKLPGPGLWKVSKGDHVLWILGTITPLPKRMEWTSTQVEAVVAASQQVLMPPSAEMKTDTGFFGGLMLLPKLLKARNNPGEKMLAEVVPEATYARWTVLKQRYLGRDRGVEKRRPIIAAGKLADEAMDDSDLSPKNIARRVVEKAAKKHDIEIVTPQIEVTIADPKALIKELGETSLDDVDCFEKTLEKFDSEIETMKLRANAWALGEIEILQQLPLTDTYRVCTDAILESRLAKQQGWAAIEGRVEAEWHKAADAALAKNASTFAVLPLYVMLREDGYLQALAARGYRVEAPGKAADDATSSGVAAADDVAPGSVAPQAQASGEAETEAGLAGDQP